MNEINLHPGTPFDRRRIPSVKWFHLAMLSFLSCAIRGGQNVPYTYMSWVYMVIGVGCEVSWSWKRYFKRVQYNNEWNKSPPRDTVRSQANPFSQMVMIMTQEWRFSHVYHCITAGYGTWAFLCNQVPFHSRSLQSGSDDTAWLSYENFIENVYDSADSIFLPRW
jgi:hypothetical protein